MRLGYHGHVVGGSLRKVGWRTWLLQRALRRYVDRELHADGRLEPALLELRPTVSELHPVELTVTYRRKTP